MKKLVSAASLLFVVAALTNALVLLIRNFRILKRLEDEPPSGIRDIRRATGLAQTLHAVSVWDTALANGEH